MKKKCAGMLVGLSMALMIAFPAMATETTADAASGEIAVVTAEIPSDNADAIAEGNETAAAADAGVVPAEGGEEATADVLSGDDAEVTAEDPAEDTGEETAADEVSGETASTEAAAAQTSVEETGEAEPTGDENGIMTLSSDASEEEEEEGDEDSAVSVTGVKLNKSKLTIRAKDQTIQLVATVSPKDADDASVTWKSSNTKVVTVDKDGKLTAVKDGTATITVMTTDGKFTATCTVTVSLYSDGFHQDPDGSDWCYYKNGKIATGTTGLIQGTVDGTSGYWNVVKGRVSASATIVKGTVDGTSAWWYVNKKGRVDTSYTGFAKNSSGTWYAEKGKVSKKTNGVYKDATGAIGAKNSWYYVLNSKVQTDFTGLADYSNASGWWYITNGKVDRSVTTVAKNKNGWWYVKNGKVDRSYTGFAKNGSGSWYAVSGKVSKKANGVYKDSTGAIGKKNSWYYVLNSKVQTGFTGLADYSNASGWWYITNGKVDRSVTTVAKNKNGWWYVKNGKVNLSYTGTAQNSNGWWYVEKGKVDRSAVALVRVSGVWQAYKSGKFASDYTGIAVNENGMWYVKNGVLDRSYSGTFTDSSGTWSVVNGKATSSGERGWVKVGSNYYYYDRSTGKMAKSTTVDGIKLDSSGKAQVSSDDVYKIKTMISARELMESITKTGDSKATMLRKCFDWTVDMSYHRIRYASQTRRENPDTWTCIFANDAFANGSGTCYTQACAFAYLAKECGYDVAICDDTGHAWVEIDGLVYDPDSARSNFSKYYGTTPEAAGRKYIYKTEI